LNGSRAESLSVLSPDQGRLDLAGWLFLFQPHRYTRTRDLFKEFMSAFNEADVLIVTDIYAAGEKQIKGVSSQKIFTRASNSMGTRT